MLSVTLAALVVNICLLVPRLVVMTLVVAISFVFIAFVLVVAHLWFLNGLDPTIVLGYELRILIFSGLASFPRLAWPYRTLPHSTSFPPSS